MQFQNRGKSLKTRVNHFIHAPIGRALSQSDCSISVVNQLYLFGVIECTLYQVSITSWAISEVNCMSSIQLSTVATLEWFISKTISFHTIWLWIMSYLSVYWKSFSVEMLQCSEWAASCTGSLIWVPFWSKMHACSPNIPSNFDSVVPCGLTN